MTATIPGDTTHEIRTERINEMAYAFKNAASLIGAIELAKNKKTRELFDPMGDVGTKCKDHCLANGLIMRATRDVMVMSPPLTITHKEIDIMVDRARKALDETAKDIGVK